MPKGVYKRKKRVTRAKRRKPGRPKGSQNKVKRAGATKAAAGRRRGRPPGSGVSSQLAAIGASVDSRLARIEALLRNASAPVFVTPAAMAPQPAQAPQPAADPS